MEGEARRIKILDILKYENGPVSGTELAARLKVSRQVIVQDIALLRAVDKNILSTNKGYLLFSDQNKEAKVTRSFKVKHQKEEISDELNCIVDCGGKVLDVVVEHDIYGQICVDLIIHNRTDVENFVKKVELNRTRPLNDLTNGIHFHTVEAPNEEILQRIEQKLNEKGYLIIS